MSNVLNRRYIPNKSDETVKRIFLPRGTADVDPPHIARLKRVGRWRLPSEGSPEWVDMRLQSAASMRDPRYRQLLKDTGKVAHSTSIAVQQNGAGLPSDAGMREFIVEYNSRNSNFGLHYMPSSFNVLESFTDYLPKYALFVPLPERDHICSISGFLDYISSANSEGIVPLRIRDDIVYNYSFIEKPGQWIFGGGDSVFTICSVAMVRHENEVTLMCLAGIKEDLATSNKSVVKAASSVKENSEKPGLRSDPSLTPEAVALDQARQFRRAYFALRYDLAREVIQVRYVLLDSGNMWAVKTDDPISMEHVARMLDSDLAHKHAEAVAPYEEFFVFIIRMLRLPEYFEKSSQYVIEDRSITELQDLKGIRGRKILDHALKNHVVYERKVSTLIREDNEMTEIILPSFELKVEVEGYWERLEFGSYGVGQDGERVLGRTWVRKTLSKRESKIGGNTFAMRQAIPIIGGAEEGFIYVLRNASHQLDIFKIGLTRRNVQTRAMEVSRGTGVPDRFLTVQTWHVPDVVYAEKRIHELLSSFRLTDRREFFQADYQQIRAAVDMVVGEMSGRSVS